MTASCSASSTTPPCLTGAPPDLPAQAAGPRGACAWGVASPACTCRAGPQPHVLPAPHCHGAKLPPPCRRCWAQGRRVGGCREHGACRRRRARRDHVGAPQAAVGPERRRPKLAGPPLLCSLQSHLIQICGTALRLFTRPQTLCLSLHPTAALPILCIDCTPVLQPSMHACFLATPLRASLPSWFDHAFFSARRCRHSPALSLPSTVPMHASSQAGFRIFITRHRHSFHLFMPTVPRHTARHLAYHCRLLHPLSYRVT